MGFLAAVGGVLCGTLVSLAIGVILDYLILRNVLPTSVTGWMLTPWLMAAGGFVGSLIGVSMHARYLRDRSAGSPAPTSRGTAAASRRTSSATSSTSASKSVDIVPGIPHFDLDAARAQAAAERKSIEGMQQGPKP